MIIYLRNFFVENISESPVTMSMLTAKVEREFEPFAINTDPYLREVRKALYSNMFGQTQITITQYNAFCDRFNREGGIFNKRISEPKYDAWCLIRGMSRNIFNYKKFFAKYPSCYEQVTLLRKIIGVKVKDGLK